jgi:hypothetical protein
MKAQKKMHVGYRVKPEWGIGGLKSKWQRLMKRFDYAKPKFSHLFHNATLLTFFWERQQMEKQKRKTSNLFMESFIFHFGVLNFITRFLQLSLLENKI